MKPVNKNVADAYHRESMSGVDAVFKRMLKVVGDYGEGYARAFDVSDNTVKTWRRRGAVSLRYLEGFAREHDVSLDYLLYGNEAAATPNIPLELSADERELLALFRAASLPVKAAAIGALQGGSTPPPAKVKKQTTINVGTNHGQTAEKIVNKKP